MNELEMRCTCVVQRVLRMKLVCPLRTSLYLAGLRGDEEQTEPAGGMCNLCPSLFFSRWQQSTLPHRVVCTSGRGSLFVGV